MKEMSVIRILVTFAAVSLAASSLIAAERTVVDEHFTATW